MKVTKNSGQDIGVEGGVFPTRPNVSIGQAKYAVRGMGPSIYQDKTRYTADDEKAAVVSDTGECAMDNYQDGKNDA